MRQSPEDADAYRPGTERQHGWNLFHINALYDLENGIYTDIIVQKEHTKHESRALCQMAERAKTAGPAILLADRNYEAYNNFAHLEEKGWKYLIRLKDQGRKNAYGITLPDQPEFDLPVRITLGRLTPRQLEQRGLTVPEPYYRIPNSVTFDFLEPESEKFYTFSARIVRFGLQDGNTETLITNLFTRAGQSVPIRGQKLPIIVSPQCTFRRDSLSLRSFLGGAASACLSCAFFQCAVWHSRLAYLAANDLSVCPLHFLVNLRALLTVKRISVCRLLWFASHGRLVDKVAKEQKIW